MSINDFASGHKLLFSQKYNWAPIDKGYNNRTLHIHVGTGLIHEKPVTPLMKEKFIGGKGFDLRLLWDATQPDTQWNDPDNEIVISGGPCCGITQYSGSGKSICTSISPQTDIVIDSNVGGFFGPYLKWCGFDALELQGKADKDVIILLDEARETVEIFEAGPADEHDSHLLAEYFHETLADNDHDRINVAVVSAGRAAESSLIGMLNFSFYDLKRQKVRLKQAGRGGIGTVLRDKKILAVVAKTKGTTGNRNNVVNLEAIIDRGRIINKEIRDFDDVQCEMRSKGTAHLTNVMNDYDLLPVFNFKYGSHPDIYKIHSDEYKKYFSQGRPDGCWMGCNLSCSKGVDDFLLKTGPYQEQKVIVDGPEYETSSSLGSVMGIFDPEWTIEANFYCDTYGICTITWGTIMGFIMECYENGILNQERTGGLQLNFGNKTDAMELLHQLARGEGFGLTAGLGVRKMKELFTRNGWGDPGFLRDIGMENKGLEYSQYVSKESLAQQGGYAMTNKGPQHDEAWLIFMDMVNNMIPTFEQKAEALHYFPMFRTWFGLAGFCKLPWNDIEPENNSKQKEPNKVPEHVDNYVTLFNAVTGSHIDKEELIRQSEKVYNFQRIFNIRRGYGLRKHDAQPYRACGPVTVEEYESRRERYDNQLRELVNIVPEGMDTPSKVAALRAYREDRYEQLLDAVYQRRGWNKNGVPKIEHLKNIGMDLPELIEVVAPLQE